MRRVLLSSVTALALVAAAIPAVAGAADAAAAGARAAAPRTTPPEAWTDFNGDGSADLAIGAPFDDVAGKAGAGVVNVLYGSGTGVTPTSQVWHQDSTNVTNPAEAGDHFGWALATGDYDGDTFADLAIGVPDEDVQGVANVGGINLLFGSAAGLVARSSQSLLLDGNTAGSRLGYALTALDTKNVAGGCTPGADGYAELAAGQPGAGNAGEGRVIVFAGSLLVTSETGCGETISTPVGGSPGAAGGRALAAGDVNGDLIDDLAVGIPLADHNDGMNVTVDAGAVAVYNGNGLTTLMVLVQGDDLGDDAEANDRVGESLAMADLNGDGVDEIAIGVPHEDLPAGADAGAVHVLSGNLVINMTLTADSPGVPGVASAGDRFGGSLAFGKFESATSGISLAIGMPGENVTGLTGAGAVVVIYNDGSGLGTSDNDRWTQDSAGILDVAETGDAFGSSLFPADFDGDGDMDLAIGIPRENIGSIADAGAVAVLYAVTPGTAGLTATNDDFWHQDVPGIGEVAQAGDRFGAGLP